MSKRNYINTRDIKSIQRRHPRADMLMKGAYSKNLIGREEALNLKKRKASLTAPGDISSLSNRNNVIRILSSDWVGMTDLLAEINGQHNTPIPIQELRDPVFVGSLQNQGNTSLITRETRDSHTVQAEVPWLTALQWIQRGNRNGAEYGWEIEPIPCLWPPIDPESGEVIDVNGDGEPDWSVDDGNCVHVLSDVDGDGLITVDDLSSILCSEEGILCSEYNCEEDLQCNPEQCGYHDRCPSLYCGSCEDGYTCVSGECTHFCDQTNPSPCGAYGDVNCDGIVNVVDVVAVVGTILGTAPTGGWAPVDCKDMYTLCNPITGTPTDECMAPYGWCFENNRDMCTMTAMDILQDGLINVVDIVEFINEILGRTRSGPIEGRQIVRHMKSAMNQIIYQGEISGLTIDEITTNVATELWNIINQYPGKWADYNQQVG